MGSEVEDLPFTSIEDSDDSLLDIKEVFVVLLFPLYCLVVLQIYKHNICFKN